MAVFDSGYNSLTDEEVLEFFDLIQIPIEIEPLSLENYKYVIEKTFEG